MAALDERMLNEACGMVVMCFYSMLLAKVIVGELNSSYVFKINLPAAASHNLLEKGFVECVSSTRILKT